jgi:hypothetical protein
MLFFSAVSSEVLELLREVQDFPILDDFYLVGGTALALKFGHRISIEDIAAMKLNSTMNRGSKKDFYDIYELLNHFTLQELISFYTSKYDFSSQLILLKSLVYFDDAEQEPDPVSVKPTSWGMVKHKVSEMVGLFAKR